MVTENLLKECLAAVNTRIENEADKVYMESREKILLIVEEEIRNHFPVGNFPACPVPDFSEDEYYGKKSEELSKAILKDMTGGWGSNGDC